MNALKKMIVPMGLLSVLCAIPSMAQITNRGTFDAPSAFYAGNAKMPAGSYSASQPNADDKLLLIEDTSGSPSAFSEDEVVTSNTPHAQPDVTLNKYGNVAYLTPDCAAEREAKMHVLPSHLDTKAAT